MLVLTVWMILDDFGREWKGYQLEFFNLRKKKTEQMIEDTKKGMDEAKLKELQANVAAAVTELSSHQKEIDKLEDELVKLKTKEKIATNTFQGAKAAWDVDKYKFEAHYGHEIVAGHAEHGDPKAQKARAALDKGWENVLKLKDGSNQAIQAVEDKQKELSKYFEKKEATEKAVKVMRSELDVLQMAKDATTINITKLVRNAPILDLASPVLKINQIVIPTIKDDIFFAQVGKVDRCTTCHLAIDLPGFENEKQPYRTHSRLDVMLSSRSPHSIDAVGCTVCHDGRGPAVDFIRTAHTPRNEEQKKEWKKKYGWYEMHHVIEKMIPIQYTEGKCRVCHQQTEYVPRASKLNQAVQLIKSTGCYGCHKINGWEHLRKPAPSLKRVKGKLDRGWMVKWIRNPKSFNEYARMPAPFHQSNITTDQFRDYQEAEIHAVTDFILDESEEYQPNVRLAQGNKDRGKQIFGSVGCLGCHGMDDFGRQRFGQAPDLSSVGSKVSAAWLTSWLKNPRHYWADTVMPSLRLSDSEISDVSAYLLSKKNEEFEKAEVGSPDIQKQKEVLRLYLMRDPKLAPNTNEKVDALIASLKPQEVSHKLGENVMNRYGCFSCHEVKGFEKTPGIAPELSEVGSKPLNKFDFGLLHVEPHANYAWMEKKLQDPRIYDKGVAKEYLDLLKMPNFHFEDKEIQTLITALLGMTAQKIGAPSAKILTARETKMEEGMRVIHQYNCQGCHIVERLHQPLPDDHPDRDEHEKNRFALEGRILRYYEEDEATGPPPIHGEGRKVLTNWAYNFLQGPWPLRVGLKVRMPTFQFNNRETNKLVEGWGNEGNVSFPITPPQRVNLTPAQVAQAKQMVEKLQCYNCHAQTENVPGLADNPVRGYAPSFFHVAQRLRREWIVDWLKDPNKLQPGTRMPGFWADNTTPFPDVLKGDPQAQMELIADYLIYLSQNNRIVYNSSNSTPASPPSE